MGKFVSRISAELLHLGLWNLVQALGMTICIVYKRLSILIIIVSYIRPVSFSPIKLFITDFWSPMRAKVFCTHLLRIEAYRVREQQDVVIYFALYFFLFLFPSICDSNVRHSEICVNDFSGNTALRILKVFGKIVFYLLYYVKQNHHTPAYYSFYLNFFLFFFFFCFLWKSITNLLSFIRASLQILYTPWQ